MDRDLFEKLSNQSIQKYLDLKGIGYTRNGNYLKLMDHDSLVIDTRITDQKKCETFFWNSKGIGGNLYQFMREYLSMESTDILKELKELSPELSKAVANRYEDKKYAPEKWKNKGNHEQVKDYLINKRKLSTRLVNGLIDRDLLRELKYGDALFVWKEKGQEVGSDIQGTRIDHEKYGDRGTKKMVVPGSKKNYGFNFSVRTKADKQKFFIFESPIDALSFYQTYMPQNYQKKDEGYRFISLNGAGTKLETIGEFFKTVGVPDELHLNFDADKAGVKAFMKLIVDADIGFESKFATDEKQVKVYADIPKSVDVKDWNEALQKGETEFTTLDMPQYIEYVKGKLGDKVALDIATEAAHEKKKFDFVKYPKEKNNVQSPNVINKRKSKER